MNIKSKLPDVALTIFSKMSQLAVQYKAVNMGQGYPDYNPDHRLIKCVHEAMLAGHNQYAPMIGVERLRHAIRNQIIRLYGRSYDPNDEITITSGATEALSASIIALVHPGDEVIIIEPAYDLYAPTIRLVGAIPQYAPMHRPSVNHQNYQINWEAVERLINNRTRMIILNSPHNPTGFTLQTTDLDRLEKIIEQHKLILLSDEAYEHIVFDGIEHLSLATRPALAERSVVISSFGKTFHATGWKIGYCCSPKKISAEIRKVHQFMVFSVPTPLQVGLAEYMNSYAEVHHVKHFYQKKRDRLVAGLQTTGFEPLECQGTFFLIVNYQKISDKPEQLVAEQLTKKHGVATIPVSAFYQNPAHPSSNQQLLRLCFAKQDQTIDVVADRLSNVYDL
ncbi:aminotransferase class I/II-fold pyridoxal phosphate-dependent enzyme [Alcaligenaceae bacterium CGII-47]|nr:aminotransferase class I/II-fold pyridoxal phosphate-dependent enzyme [Alcaligenaceae bacterium CGII-47]